MAENQVTIDGSTYPLAQPFMVVATQNPIEMDGTYPLPEAQRDRFTARVSVGYPDMSAELAMVDEHAAADPLEQLRPVTDARWVSTVIEAVRRIHVAPEVRQYCVELVGATRRLPELRLGASPRCTLQLVRAAKAQAALAGRGFVVPDDVQAVAVPVLAHRLLLTPDAVASRRSAIDIVRGLLGRQAVPAPSRRDPEPAGRGRGRAAVGTHHPRSLHARRRAGHGRLRRPARRARPAAHRRVRGGAPAAGPGGGPAHPAHRDRRTHPAPGPALGRRRAARRHRAARRSAAHHAPADRRRPRRGRPAVRHAPPVHRAQPGRTPPGTPGRSALITYKLRPRCAARTASAR
jgi:Mg-chelatase subunit ChlI